jgi:hypothetical protein
VQNGQTTKGNMAPGLTDGSDLPLGGLVRDLSDPGYMHTVVL